MEIALVILAVIAAFAAIAFSQKVRSDVYAVLGSIVGAATVGLFVAGRWLEWGLAWRMRYYLDASDPFGFQPILLVGGILTFGLLIALIIRQSDPQLD